MSSNQYFTPKTFSPAEPANRKVRWANSKPQTTYLNDNLLRKDWELPLSLGILGWFNDLNSEQLQNKEWHHFPFENLSLTKAQIREFLYRLAGEEGYQYSGLKWRCGGKEFIYANKVLNLMDIPLAEQEILFELCQKYGGNCDCEILMNAAPWLLNEETPW